MSYLYLNFRKIAKFVPSYIHPLVNTNSSRLAYSTESSFHPLVFVSWVGGGISWQISNLQIWKNTAVVFYDKYQSCNTAGKYLLLTVDFTQEIGEGADTVRVWFKNRWNLEIFEPWGILEIFEPRGRIILEIFETWVNLEIFESQDILKIFVYSKKNIDQECQRRQDLPSSWGWFR